MLKIKLSSYTWWTRTRVYRHPFYVMFYILASSSLPLSLFNQKPSQWPCSFLSLLALCYLLSCNTYLNDEESTLESCNLFPKYIFPFFTDSINCFIYVQFGHFRFRHYSLQYLQPCCNFYLSANFISLFLLKLFYYC